MTEFKLPFLGSRRRSGARGSTAPLDEIAVQIRELDEAAQRASRQINQSGRRLRASHKWHPELGDDALAELATSLVERTDAIRADCEQLAALLERAKRTVEEGPVEPTAAAAARAPKPKPPLEEDWDAARAALEGVPETLASTLLDKELGEQQAGSAWRGPVPNGRASASPAVEGVRLIATQMAIAGSTRPEIQTHLHDRFGIDDAKPVLDEIFGDSSAEVSDGR